MNVSAVIPTYNGKHLLEKHLQYVVDTLKKDDELIIVDDHSTDGTVPWLIKTYHLNADAKDGHTAAFQIYQGKHPSKKITLTIIANHQNVRFGQAVNRGVQAAEHDYVVLFNNDVRPRKNTIKKALSHFKDRSVFAVGFKEEEPQSDGSIILGGKNRIWFEKGRFIHSRASNFETGPTAWASGGSAIFDKKKWQHLGGFDPAYYPAYWEDIDLSYRAHQAGWKVLFESNAVVEHHHETTNQAVFGNAQIAAMSWKNGSTFVWKNGTLYQKVAHILWKPYWWFLRSLG